MIDVIVTTATISAVIGVFLAAIFIEVCIRREHEARRRRGVTDRDGFPCWQCGQVSNQRLW